MTVLNLRLQVLLALSLLAVNSSLAAFIPTGKPKGSTAKKVWGVPRTVLPEKAGDNDVVLDENFDDVPLVRLLGLNRIQKKMRKYKRESNEGVKTPEIITDAPASSGNTATSSGKDVSRLIIAGAPASGKGTQCEMIKERYGVVHLSTGDMLRAAVADKTEVGILAQEYMDAGKLVPDEVIIGVVKDRLAQKDCVEKGWLLDGFPRTPAQAEALSEAGISADCFLFLNVPDEVLVERVVGRRTDPETGKIYHMTFSPPEDEDVLARLEQRSDDTEEKVKVRLQQFHANVDAVKGSYTDIIVEINGTDKPENVAVAVENAISSKISS
uniref:Adenylate kinase active site lid domain-containing protein n=1 Tax=Eucampia antarctica TaxID=49252 RepID=A0A7S2WR25_9STRA|mmetsp:Transcript_9798/g.9460  ORF Transcript_9798/g.9460 Transcript_9798/m.9460 type:complete len:326 (+) Transcript_9798:49-1026(+)|eukprot:CAMPEP_0197831608 /NCGR_PEP_ID=MMETSP1437-20131217/11278_1 /TAXON_ID=49252 ORGANISM="Eucampia antarctica, Strain CCMP1452" /NCGR_SAMPLE_ID=MMETSP1437 /ASSEMBLY_ACC=CAM_ASM_001096 /LENGTH=325 /DNA_ID=CAMNT_0043434607 /DNA_START=37 /DNA_END=1014 /DNA_ORIENTATION=+